MNPNFVTRLPYGLYLAANVTLSVLLAYVCSYGYAYDNSCGVNYFNGWCKEREKETLSGNRQAENSPYIWQPKFAGEPPPPLVDVFRDPSPENIARYQEWYKERMERVTEIGLILSGRDRQVNSQVTSSDLRLAPADGAKPVIFDKAVYFFDEECPVCARMTPLLSEFQQSGKLVGIGIKSTDDGTSAYLRRSGVDIPSAGDNSGDIARNYGVAEVPALVLLSGSGDIVGRYEGFMDKPALLRLFGVEQ